jgi:DNA-nicking Smr family endonuclease
LFYSGNRALAKSLSRQGHDLNAQMKQLHFCAAQAIFESRNPDSQLYSEQLMDLHGLHVAEAVEFLTRMLPKLADEGLETIYLVTGSGHHSKGPQGNARLLPAIEQFLAAEGYQFSSVPDGRGYVGMLLVDLRW